MNKEFDTLCVYCGASTAVANKYTEEAYNVGRFLAQSNISLVYGGGNIGLMKAVADGCLEKNGNVTGVIPHKLQELELSHPEVQKMYVTQGMHERKALMAQLSDGFIALPGGFGTLEELAEITTWSQLNYHSKPVGLLNVFGYYDHLIQWITNAVNEQFIRPQHQDLLVHSDNVQELIEKMKQVAYPDLREVL